MTWIERRLEWLRSLDPTRVDLVLAASLLVISIITVFNQDLVEGMDEAPPYAVATILLVTLPVVVRRQRPLGALSVAGLAMVLHLGADWPEGALPLTMMVLTYTVGSYAPPRRAVAGLLVVYSVLVLLGLIGTPGLDTLGVAGNMTTFTVGWTVGVALRARRLATEAEVREADERAQRERQSSARALAEERLAIAQELHDVVAHSMSVIAVQAGAGAHVIDRNPEQARAALEAISATSRGTLAELRRLLGVLRDDEGDRSHAPAPRLADLPALVEDVRAAGVPVHLMITGEADRIQPGVELSAYRIVQEALTNVIKHAGPVAPVDVTVSHEPGRIVVEVVDDGRGAAVLAARSAGAVDGPDAGGHGLVGMRERVELWGGELEVGPIAGGGYRVWAVLPYGEAP